MDVVAIGLTSGKIVIHNLKYDETLMTFQQDWGPITAIAFRTGEFTFFSLILHSCNRIVVVFFSWTFFASAF